MTSPYFSLYNCKFSNQSNDYNKRNCARLGAFRDFALLNSYTIELSCFGYEVKGSGGAMYDCDVAQFQVKDFVSFG